MSRGVWKTVEAGARMIGVGKIKKEEAKEEKEEKREEKEQVKKKENQRKRKNMQINKVAEEWEIWDEEEKAAKLEEEVKKLVPK